MYAKDEPVTKAVEEEKLNKYHWRLLIILMFVWLFSSMNQMFYSLTVPLIMEEWKLTYVVIGVIWSAMLLPSVFGSMTFGTLADYFGRKKCLIAAVLGFFTPRVLVGLTQNWVQLAAVMAMASFGHGGIFPTVFSMVSEELPARKRGFCCRLGVCSRRWCFSWFSSSCSGSSLMESSILCRKHTSDSDRFCVTIPTGITCLARCKSGGKEESIAFVVAEDQEFQARKAVGTQVPQEDTLNIFGEIPR